MTTDTGTVIELSKHDLFTETYPGEAAVKTLGRFRCALMEAGVEIDLSKYSVIRADGSAVLVDGTEIPAPKEKR